MTVLVSNALCGFLARLVHDVMLSLAVRRVLIDVPHSCRGIDLHRVVTDAVLVGPGSHKRERRRRHQ